MGKQRIEPNYRCRVLRLPDLDHCKLAVLNNLGSPARAASMNGSLLRLLCRLGDACDQNSILSANCPTRLPPASPMREARTCPNVPWPLVLSVRFWRGSSKFG
jgi:hypothetical protein